MKNVIKSQVKAGLNRFGINVTSMKSQRYNPELYINSLRGAISIKKPLNIVQVGANDGKYNDPIYNFVKSHKDFTNIILIEPIQSVIPYLEENYSYHSSAEIVNKAIGDKKLSSIQLYGVNQDYWDDINAGYGEEWPKYRIPTGVTTTDKDQLLQWISENVQSDANPENIIRMYDIETVQPDLLINESQNMDDVQLLQVDAEGMDDKIVYSFIESDIRPNIINIESKHLNQAKIEKFNKIMNKEGYNIYDYTSSEKLAMK